MDRTATSDELTLPGFKSYPYPASAPASWFVSFVLFTCVYVEKVSRVFWVLLADAYSDSYRR